MSCRQTTKMMNPVIVLGIEQSKANSTNVHHISWSHIALEYLKVAPD